MKLLTRQEEILLLAIWQLKGNAYGVTLREYISKVTGKYWSIGSIYVPLDKLVNVDMLKPTRVHPPKNEAERVSGIMILQRKD